MHKVGGVVLIVAGMTLLYVIMLLVMPAIVSIVGTANVEITENTTAMPGSRDILISAPWYLWFVPAVIGIAVIIGYLKS